MECLSCKKYVAESISAATIEKDGNVEFIRCQYCGAKNILTFLPVNSGPDKFYFERFVIDQGI